MPPDIEASATAGRRRRFGAAVRRALARAIGPGLACLVLAPAGADAAGAQPMAPEPAGSAPAIAWSTVDAGQAVLSAAGLRLSATVGQADVPADQPMTGGGYQLRAGYWLTPAPSGDRIFANGFDLPN